mmetsp:Transcript_6437/g.23002  ORF Transcript_6437/g.23002 Transcript_6437/m.23002 type:complete len:260 (-) Transcript_6437:362-1141(-)
MEELAHELRELPHHPRGLLSGLRQGDKELRGELSGGCFQVGCLRDCQDGVHNLDQVLAQEGWVLLPDLNEHPQRLLGRGLVALVQRRAQTVEHAGHQVLELVPLALLLQRGYERARRPERGVPDVHVLALQALAEHVVQGGEVGRQGHLDRYHELGEDPQDALQQRVVAALHALKHEGQELGPLLFLQEHGTHVADGVAHHLGGLLVLLVLNQGQELGLHALLGGLCQGLPRLVVRVRGECLPQQDRAEPPKLELLGVL